jgi:hypothetical protein
MLLEFAGGYPAKLDIFMCVQSFVQFACVLLDVPDVVKLQFQFVEGEPVKP